MWITNGPTSIVPVCGDGIEASTTAVILPSGPDACVSYVLEEDSECEIRRAATLEQLDRRVEVNVVPHSQPTGRTWLVPGTLELFRTPSLDALDLRRIDQGDVSCRHAVLSRRLHSLFGQTTRSGLPIAGDFEVSQKFYAA